MAAETARKFAALEAQAGRLMGSFIAAGYEAVAPAVIQPADVYLDAIGEALRARSYVFTDPDGDELCLRPDLTVPTCRLHLERNADPTSEARYCYNGQAFRFQPQGADSAHPREFRQAGIELFGARSPLAADAEVLGTLVRALSDQGLTDFQLRFGDLGLFRSLLASIDMPERWRSRLQHQFWRPDAFRDELERLTDAPSRLVSGLDRSLVAALDPSDPEGSEARIARYLEQNGIDLVGSRSLQEITESLLARAADAKSDPLPRDAAAMIEGYLAVKSPAAEAASCVKNIARAEGADIAEALIAFQKRLDLLAAEGIDIERAEFSAEFGRTLEYYTGFVFEVVVPGLGAPSPVAGGGRYDGLMRTVGAACDVPAVGGAIHTERLLAAVSGSRP